MGVSNMLNITHVKADFKQIIREPVLILFMIIPLFIFIVFKTLIVFLFPFILELTGFEISKYFPYVLTVSFLMTPQMLGTVAGFLMIDERDSNIYELMSVTPLGYSGYITNRLLIPLVFGVVYSVIGYYILNIYNLSIPLIIFIGILMGLEGTIASLILFNLADDKVKGLTISKAMGVFPLVALADLLEIKWISIASNFFPYYWISKIIIEPSSFYNILMASIIHIVWLIVIVKIGKGD